MEKTLSCGGKASPGCVCTHGMSEETSNDKELEKLAALLVKTNTFIAELLQESEAQRCREVKQEYPSQPSWMWRFLKAEQWGGLKVGFIPPTQAERQAEAAGNSEGGGHGQRAALKHGAGIAGAQRSRKVCWACV